jgi:hypothetical protein
LLLQILLKDFFSYFTEVVKKIFCIFFERASVCLSLFGLCRPFCIFLRDVWIRTRRAAIASRRATNLAIHLLKVVKFYLNFHAVLLGPGIIGVQEGGHSLEKARQYAALMSFGLHQASRRHLRKKIDKT